jgi:hypothetical protein
MQITVAVIFCNNTRCIVHLQRLATIQLKLKFFAGLYRKPDKLSLVSIKRKVTLWYAMKAQKGIMGVALLFP